MIFVWQRVFRPSFLSIFGRPGGALNHENHAKPLYCRMKSRFPKNQKSEVRSRLWAPFWEPFGVILAPLASKSVKKASKKNTRKNSRKKVTRGLQAEGLGSLKEIDTGNDTGPRDQPTAPGTTGTGTVGAGTVTGTGISHRPRHSTSCQRHGGGYYILYIIYHIFMVCRFFF